MGLEWIIDSLLQDRILTYIIAALVAALLLLLVALRLWASSGGDKQPLRPPTSSGGSVPCPERSRKGQAWPFFAKRPLTAAEQTLYHCLVKALPEHIILAQVQLSQLLGVRKGHNFQEWFNRINRLSADFVVCTKDATVIAVIELDDGNRDRGERQSADLRTHKALAAANIRLLRWQVWTLPDAAEIRRQLFTPDQVPQRDESSAAPLRAIH